MCVCVCVCVCACVRACVVLCVSHQRAAGAAGAAGMTGGHTFIWYRIPAQCATRVIRVITVGMGPKHVSVPNHWVKEKGAIC